MNSTNPFVVLDEDVLIAKASSGDLQAFNQLVLIYQNMAFYHASAIFGDPTMAEEATQQGFIKAFHGLNGFRGGSFRSWLLKMVEGHPGVALVFCTHIQILFIAIPILGIHLSVFILPTNIPLIYRSTCHHR